MKNREEQREGSLNWLAQPPGNFAGRRDSHSVSRVEWLGMGNDMESCTEAKMSQPALSHVSGWEKLLDMTASGVYPLQRRKWVGVPGELIEK